MHTLNKYKDQICEDNLSELKVNYGTEVAFQKSVLSVNMTG